MTFWDWVAGSPCWAGSFLVTICYTVGYVFRIRARVRNNETTGRMFEAVTKKGNSREADDE